MGRKSAFEGVLGPLAAANPFDELARGNRPKARTNEKAPEI